MGPEGVVRIQVTFYFFRSNYFKVTGADKQADGSYKVNMENVKSGKVESLDADVIMVCVGRRPYTETLGLETCGIEVNERGQVPVDDNFKVTLWFFIGF